LNALAKERKQLSDEGYDDAAKPVGDAIKKLLAADVISELAKRGFLPRYAFPLDVTTLETSFTRWSADSDVELGRDRGIAISEFAPEAQVIARKQAVHEQGAYTSWGTTTSRNMVGMRGVRLAIRFGLRARRSHLKHRARFAESPRLMFTSHGLWSRLRSAFAWTNVNALTSARQRCFGSGSR
jgi:hypothetical protein